MWNPNVRSKTKVPIFKLAGLLAVTAVFLLFPLLSLDVRAGSYRRPTPSSRPTEKVTPATLLNVTESIQYMTPAGGTQNAGSFNVGGTTAAFGVDLSTLLNTVPIGAYWLDKLAREATVYHVEGRINEKLVIDQSGNIYVNAAKKPIYFYFNDRESALAYYELKAQQPGFIGGKLKSFTLPEAFLNQLQADAITEQELHAIRVNPNIAPEVKQAYELRPHIAGGHVLEDNQFGLYRPQITKLKEIIEREQIVGTQFSSVAEAVEGTPFPKAPLPSAGASASTLAQTDAMLARRLAPVIEKISSVTSKLLEPIETIGAALASRFPEAAAHGASFMKALAPFAKAGGIGLGALGVIFGLMNLGVSGPRLFELIKEHGLGVLGSREGVVAVMHTLADALETLAGGAVIAALISSETVVGGIGFGAAALILTGAMFALRGTAWIVENWEAVKAAAVNVWEGIKDGAARTYRWVENSASATAAWAGEQVDKLVTKTKNVLAATGVLAGELVRGAVQVAEKVVEQVTVMVTKIVEYVEDKVTNVVRTGVRMAERMVDEVKTIMEPVVRIGERMVTRLVDAVRQVPRTIYETATRLVDKVVPVVRTVTDWVTTKVQEAYQYAVQVVRNVTEWTVERVREAYVVVSQVPRQITEWTVERVRETRQVARTVYNTVYEWVTEWVPETYRVVSQVARTVWETVTEWVPQSVRSWLGRFWGWATRWVARTFQRARTVYDTVVSYATRWVQRSRQVARQVARTVYDTVAEWVNRSRQVTRTVYDTVRETLYRWVARPVQRVRQIVETVWRTGTRLVDKVVPVVRTVTDWVTTKVAETYQIVRTVYDTIVEKVPQLVRETYEYIEQVPRTIMTQVKKLVPEQYEYTEQVIEQVTKTRTEIVPEIRQIERTVTKTVEGWIPKLP